MKKMIIILISIIVLVGGGIWWYNSTKTENMSQAKNNNSNYQVERIDTLNKPTNIKQEIEIATFSTAIHNKDENRQNNITIACNTLTTKEVQPGETFSFCDTIGKATHAKGYEEADIYVDGQKEQGLGGGLCQVSTTLYNAVLQIPELEVIERHEHSGHVPYVEEGRDAAISYGAYDFKFKNNGNNVIKIVIENTADAITAKLIKIEG